jgi:predicted glycogen debranching enzyme
MVKTLERGLFPNIDGTHIGNYNSVDAPLWFIWSLQQLEKHDNTINIWKSYKKPILEILNAYKEGTSFGIKMMENGLIYAGEEGIPVTWMDAMAHGVPVTLRKGYQVEVNALWYNAVSQALIWAEADKKMIAEWLGVPGKIEHSFSEIFWHKDKSYLADYADEDFVDFSVRPNQVIATSLDFSPLSIGQKKGVLDRVENELLTSRGLRTLSPKNVAYKGLFSGDQSTRDMAYHQGSVWPWLLEHFVKGYLEIHKRSGIAKIKRIYSEFEDDMVYRGIGTVSELYDGNPPHDSKGAISHAASVASMLRVVEMIEEYQQ